jgi:hypothetical protein
MGSGTRFSAIPLGSDAWRSSIDSGGQFFSDFINSSGGVGNFPTMVRSLFVSSCGSHCLAAGEVVVHVLPVLCGEEGDPCRLSFLLLKKILFSETTA